MAADPHLCDGCAGEPPGLVGLLLPFPPGRVKLAPSRLNQQRVQAGRRRRRRVRDSGLISPSFIGNELHAVVCLYNQGEAAELLAKAPKIS